jgi:hypothetical protein
MQGLKVIYLFNESTLLLQQYNIRVNVPGLANGYLSPRSISVMGMTHEVYFGLKKQTLQVTGTSQTRESM